MYANLLSETDKIVSILSLDAGFYTIKWSLNNPMSSVAVPSLVHLF